MSWHPTYIKRYIEHIESSTGVAIVLTDAGEGFLKPLGNVLGPHVLAREWIGTSIAKIMGLTTFDFAIIEIIEGDDIPLGHGAKALPGPAFITKKLNGAPWGGDIITLRKVTNSCCFARLLVFDTLILNPDRYPPTGSGRKPNRDNIFLTKSAESRLGEYTLVTFDHSDCLRGQSDLSPVIKNIDNVKDERVYGLFPEFAEFITQSCIEDALERLKNLTPEVIAHILSDIPRQWEINDTTKRSLNEFLLERSGFLLENMHRMLATGILGKLYL